MYNAALQVVDANIPCISSRVSKINDTKSPCPLSHIDTSQVQLTFEILHIVPSHCE